MKGINILAVYGGASIQPQIKSLKKAPRLLLVRQGEPKTLLNEKAETQ